MVVKRLIFLVAVNTLVLAAAFWLREPLPAPYAAEKRQAIELSLRAQQILSSRLTGPEFTLTTTTLAPKRAKELSLQPDFAAVFVEWLKTAGAGPGTRVAVNFSGSFPALNLSVLAAIKAIGAEPVITSSIGASTWGATDPEFTWLDMERRLQSAGLWAWQSAAASIGGGGDRGGGLTPEGRAMALAAVDKSGVPLILPANLAEAIERRLAVYRTANAGQLPAMLVNVGGNQVIFGAGGHRTPLPEGLNFGYHPLLAAHDGLAAAFLQSNRPVIHVINIAQIAARYNITAQSPPGESGACQRSGLPLPGRIILAMLLAADGVCLWQWRRNLQYH